MPAPQRKTPAKPRAKPATAKPRAPDAVTATGEEVIKPRQTDVTPINIADPVDTQDADLARETLRAVCRDPAAPAAARAQAARTLAEMAQALGRHAAPVAADRPPVGGMDRAALERELSALILG